MPSAVNPPEPKQIVVVEDGLTGTSLGDQEAEETDEGRGRVRSRLSTGDTDGSMESVDDLDELIVL